MNVWAIALVIFVVLLGLSAAAGRVQRARGARADARLRDASADELAGEVRAVVRAETWDRFPAGRALIARSAGWTDAELCETLVTLLRELSEEDAREGRQGRDSNFFDFYDLGLARIREVLDERRSA